MFGCLVRLLKELFLNQSLSSSYIQLSEFEKKLAIKAIKRKFNLHLDVLEKNQEFSFEKMLPEFSNLFVTKSVKRIEENNKFVFKHTLKAMKSNFAIQKKTISPSDIDNAFYHFYFDELVKKTETLSLRNFWIPSTTA